MPEGQRRSMSSGEFQKELLKQLTSDTRPSVHLHDIDVGQGVIEFDSESFRWELRLERVVFLSRLSFRDCYFEKDVTLLDCTFRRRVDFSGSKIDAGFSIQGGSCGEGPAPKSHGCDGQATAECGRGASLNLEFLTCQEDLRIAGVTLGGRLRARHCRVGGNFDILSVSICSTSDQPAVDLSSCRVKGGLEIGVLTPPRTDCAPAGRAPPEAAKPPAAVRTTIRLQNVCSTLPAPEAIKMRYARVNMSVTLAQSDFASSVDFSGSRFGNLSVERCKVEGDLFLSGCSIGYIHVGGLQLEGLLRLISGTSGQIFIDSFFDGHVNEDTTVGGVIGSAWTCTDWARFGFGRVGGKKESHSATVRGIRVTNCEFAGDVDFLRGVRALRSFPDLYKTVGSGGDIWRNCNPYALHLKTDHPIMVSGCKIGGHLDLTNVRSTDEIDLNGCTVAKSIRFTSPISAREAKAGRDELEKALILMACAVLTSDLKPEHRDMMRATARRLRIERTSAAKIDLSGLDLLNIGGELGSVIANHVNVVGDFQIVRRASDIEHQRFLLGLPRCVPQAGVPAELPAKQLVAVALRALLTDEKRREFEDTSEGIGRYFTQARLTAKDPAAVADPMGWCATIPGALLLESARIGKLRLTYRSFEPDPGVKQSAYHHGIVLCDATIDILRIYRRTSDKASAETEPNGFPRPVSLRGLKVRSWRLGERSLGAANGSGSDEETAETSASDLYLDLLDNDEEYRPSTYASVERSLRDLGHREAAHQVFIAGRYRENRSRPGLAGAMPWHPGDGRWRRVRWRERLVPDPSRNDRPYALVNRLTRPKGENLRVATFFVLVVILAVASTIGVHWLRWSDAFGVGLCSLLAFWALILALGIAVIGYGIWGHGFARLGDRLHWSLVNYGTSAWRLSAVILGLGILSLLAVAMDVRNFEPTPAGHLAANISTDPQKGLVFDLPCWVPKETSSSSGAALVEDDRMRPRRWGFGEALWMTARYHVPLVAFGVMEKCVPRDEPLKLFGSDMPESIWTDWLEARDWFGLMAALNFILWPLFIPFFIRRFWFEHRD